MSLGAATEARIQEVVDACAKHGGSSIVLLSGVPATGKTLISLAAAQRVAGHPNLVRQVQFHPGYSYEDFFEGLRPLREGGFEVRDGVFLDWNRQATEDPANTYVLLIEEFSRADIPAVLGELMTYAEYRDRPFELPISRREVTIAENLVLLATMNPRDRSALEIDDAIIRRLRIVDCPPDLDQLAEMLASSLPGGGADPEEAELINLIAGVFRECLEQHPDTYRLQMPFGHGIFAGIEGVDDLRDLWTQRIQHILRRPLALPHPFAETIEQAYPWRPSASAAEAEETAAEKP
jgi:AAA domain (dynein-related subfamily)